MLVTYRISMFIGMLSIETVRYYYGKVTSGFTGGATFLACLFPITENISGIGVGMSPVFDTDWKLGVLAMVAVMIYRYSSKGVYPKVEKGVTICIAAMIITFYITLVGTGRSGWKANDEGLTY